MASIKIVFNDDTKWELIEEIANAITFVLDFHNVTAVTIVDDTDECKNEQTL